MYRPPSVKIGEGAPIFIEGGPGGGVCAQATLRHPHFPAPENLPSNEKKKLMPGELSLELGGGARMQLN